MPPKSPGRTQAVVVGVDFHDPLFDERMAEAVELVTSAGAKVAQTIIGKRAKPDPGTFAGSGKIEEIAACVLEHDANLVVFNHQLSPIQIRNVEEIVGVHVIDRTDLILDIFAQRARSAEGKLQVELATAKAKLEEVLKAKETKIAELEFKTTNSGKAISAVRAQASEEKKILDVEPEPEDAVMEEPSTSLPEELKNPPSI